MPSRVLVREVRCRDLHVPLHTPFVTALRRTTTLDSLLVEVVDTDGLVGLGEAPQVWPVTGESLASARACVEGPLAAVLVDRDPRDLVPLLHATSTAVHANTSAKAAVDVALHDLAARRLGVPLGVFLGGTQGDVATDVTVAAGDKHSLTAAATARAAEGFPVLKLKVGTNAEDDVENVLAVRAAVGPAVTLRLDANQAWTPRGAVRTVRRLEDAGADVELVEQPVPARDVEGLAWVTDHVDTPVLADESVFDLRDLVTVIRHRAADMVNVKLAKAGGLLPARALLELARAHRMGTVVGSMLESPVGIGAAAALVAAQGTTQVPDLDAAWWLADRPFDGGVSYDSSGLHLPDAPGLGITLRPQADHD